MRRPLLLQTINKKVHACKLHSTSSSVVAHRVVCGILVGNMLSEESESSVIIVRAVLGPSIFYVAKINIDLQSHVSALKDQLCEANKALDTDNFVLSYSGNVMEDSVPIYMYDIFSGATVHLHKKLKLEIQRLAMPVGTTQPDLVRLGVALRSLSLNFSYKCAIKKVNKTKIINDLVYTIPKLWEDPVGINLLHHSELLLKLNDLDLVKRIAENHPGLAVAAFMVSSATSNQDAQNHFARTRTMSSDSTAGSTVPSDEEMDDLDDSSPGSDTNSQPVNRNLPFVITAAQLATAIANVTTQQPQPSTSGAGASTSTGNTGNVLVTPNNIQNQPTTPADDYSHQLGIMREMGFQCNLRPTTN